MQTISDGLRSRGAVSLCLLLTAGPLMLAQTGNGVNLQIKADQITAKMPPTFHGLMTEEINYAFEGGLYAELIRNRNFTETVPARKNRQKPPQVNVSISGLTSIAPAGKTIALSSADIDTNSIADPHKVELVTADMTGLGTEFTRTVPANSITVFELNGK